MYLRYLTIDDYNGNDDATKESEDNSPADDEYDGDDPDVYDKAHSLDDFVEHPSSDPDDEGDGDYADDAVMDSLDYEVLHHKHTPNTPVINSKVLDTKAIVQSKGYTGMTDAFGNGELFYDESSTAALLVVFGVLFVFVVLCVVYISFRQTMSIAPSTTTNAAKKVIDNHENIIKSNSKSSTLSKRRE